MQISTQSIFAASSSSLAVDSKMPGQSDTDPDFEFFDATNLEAVASPGQIINDLVADNSSHSLSSMVPSKLQTQSETTTMTSNVDQPIFSTSSMGSPACSYQDSSSESSDYPRKSSSGSVTSVLTPGDILKSDDSDLVREWNILSGDESASFPGFVDGCINPSAMNQNFFNTDGGTDHDLDFGSSPSSPSFGNDVAAMESPEPSNKSRTPIKDSSRKSTCRNKISNLQHQLKQPLKGPPTTDSGDGSPLSAMISSQGSSPNFYLSPSPRSASLCCMDYVNNNVLGPAMPKLATNMEILQHHGLPTPQRTQQMSSRRVSSQYLPMSYPLQPILTIHPTPLKSRVETQIPIKMTLFPVPMGITKLHLPTHTISKPKLLAKPTPQRSPDTLELYTSLVCTSAMQNQELRKRAFERAASSARTLISPKEEPDGSGSDEDDENKPANGGEVRICGGCIIRERKRAARKKTKKIEEEESWQKYETQRVIVFNTHEVKDWQSPSQQQPHDVAGELTEPYIPEGAMQVDAPMRIACYCRHQNEKSGFQVIFTLKDNQDKLIAQAITSSIMITDDHKTSSMPSLTPQISMGHEFSVSNQPTEGSFDTGPTPGNTAAFRLSNSSWNLNASLQRGVVNEVHTSPTTGNSPLSQTMLTSMTPNFSRQTSPTISQGPVSKKRKAVCSTKVPTALTMTRIENSESQTMAIANSTIPSPFTPSFSTFSGANEQGFNQCNSLQNITTHFNGPPTPNSTGQIFSNVNRSHSTDNLAMQQIYNTPGSGMPSRVSSPSGMRLESYQRHQAQLAHAVANGLYGIPMSLNPHRPPIIHKMIPNEGPRAGGIEVTCLGSGFVQGLEVMFGESKATTTTFWGETSLVCLLPPSAFAGNVPITFKHQQMNLYPIIMPKQQLFFKYVDDDELQILRTALSVLGHKMTGKMEDVRDIARRIVGDSSNWVARSSSGTAPLRSGTGFNSARLDEDVETILLKCLDLMDLDDSLNPPRYNLKRSSGQTMLHLACSLGLYRFVAALLARGANPEPVDKGGFTPMHFAALHNHHQIVKRLILCGATPNIRSLQGYTPADLTSSAELLQTVCHTEQTFRRRSGMFQKDRRNSSLSLKSYAGREFVSSHPNFEANENSGVDSEYEDCDVDSTQKSGFWMKPENHLPRSLSEQKFHYDLENTKIPVLESLESPMSIDSSASPPSVTAVAGVRDHISAQINYIQQTMHMSLPNLPQIPRLDTVSQILALPGYPAYFPNATPMVRRISKLVQRPSAVKEQDNKWWDLFSNSAPVPPPAYEDIFPQNNQRTQAGQRSNLDDEDFELMSKNLSNENKKNSRAFDEEKKPIILPSAQIGTSHTMTEEQRDQLRQAHAERVKRLSRDRNLFFIWIPLLIVLAMTFNHIPDVWPRSGILSTFYRRDLGDVQ
ncbi:BgTH12-01235 [Blumeria graminis f. sp. triticale]|uniref:BgTH12-01235 n=1 Tax=Blumeria graminis f. sp. triticale TaxID=1689686 RepID=A0A9W4GIA8_BLUGR|nr:BgTH12-01235 [Blumeria graminis f. sp. triticale]